MEPGDASDRDGALDGIQEAFAAFTAATVPARVRHSLAAAAGGMDHAGFPILRWLEAMGPLRLTDLAERAGLDASTVSRRVRLLEEQGLVMRTADLEDQRASILELAPEGRRRLAGLRRAHRRLLEEALGDWPTEDLQALSGLLQRLVAALTGPS